MKSIKSVEQLNQAYSEKYSIILAKTKTCNVCNAIKVRLEAIEDNYPEINFYELYLEEFPEFQGQNLIFTVPTVVFLEYGKEMHRQSRFVNMFELEKYFHNLLGM